MLKLCRKKEEDGILFLLPVVGAEAEVVGTG